MKSLQRPTLALLVFCAIAVAISVAQSNPPQNGACFYKETGYRGTNFCAQAGESLENLPPGFNDAIRSVRIFGSAQVTGYSDNRFTGASTVLRSDVPDLRILQLATDASRNWSERFSSLQIARTNDRDWSYQWGRGQNYSGTGACFFDDTNFRGRSFCVDNGKALDNLPPGFNDRIRSIRVMGNAEVQMFNDNNFGGVAARTRRDVADLSVWKIPDDPSRNWSGRISSLRVGSPRGGRWDNTGGYRDDDDDRGDFRNLVRCASQPGDRQQYCNSRGYVREASMINAYGTCRKGISWGIDDGRLWVSNGCSADFQVQR